MNIVDNPNFLECVMAGAKEDEARLLHADLIANGAMIEDNWGVKLKEGEEVAMQRGTIERVSSNPVLLAELKEILIADGREKWGHLLDNWPSQDSTNN